jgi:uncharacterized protein YbcI
MRPARVIAAGLAFTDRRGSSGMGSGTAPHPKRLWGGRTVRDSGGTEAALEAEQLTGGRLNWAIANAAVRVHSHCVGRGPTKAMAFYRGNLVVVLLQDIMTRGERTLVDRGRLEVARQMRRQFQQVMRKALVIEVEDLTRRRVVAFMSDSSIEPDLAAELFVLDRPVLGTELAGTA